ncbi:hypothetical protein TrVE_jg12382 [Triparma verrucosa]|uniref:CS domain-containing protein n=1 Tax=Triparma verrucosa TaxID=1606542 RepID=A0A9W7KRL9_9STRA|nr:hypothetical protein TrVE_jg12382 [Triparma verrucosa]
MLEREEALLSAKLAADKKTETKRNETVEVEEVKATPPAPQVEGVKAAPPAPPASSIKGWISVDKFAFDPGEYNSKSLSIYVNLANIISLKEVEGAIVCDFTKSSFDLKVVGLQGKNYRLFKDNLSHDIDVEKCRYIVKKDKIVIKLGKVKGEFSYDSWTELCCTKKKSASAKADPQASIMDMMKNMYDEGDEKMKKVIGEAMMKSRSGEKMDVEPPVPEL